MKIKKKDDKIKGIVYLSKKLNRLIKLYPSSFDDRSLKILFYDEDNLRSHANNFLKKYGMLYSLLGDLVTSKTNIDNANAAQISFIINLMQGYNKNDVFDKETHKRKSILGKMKF